MPTNTEIKIYQNYIHECYANYAKTYFSRAIYYIAKKGDFRAFTRSLFLLPDKASFPIINASNLKYVTTNDIFKKYVYDTEEFQQFYSENRKYPMDKILENFFNKSYNNKNSKDRGASDYLRTKLFDACCNEISEKDQLNLFKNLIYEHIDLSGYIKILQYPKQFGQSFERNLYTAYPKIKRPILKRVLDNRNTYIGHENNSVYSHMDASECASIINDAYQAVNQLHNENDPEELLNEYRKLQSYFNKTLESLKTSPISFDIVKEKIPDITVEIIGNSKIANRFDFESQTFYYASLKDIISSFKPIDSIIDQKRASILLEEKEKYESKIEDIQGKAEEQNTRAINTIKFYTSRLISALENDEAQDSGGIPESINQISNSEIQPVYEENKKSSLPRLKLMEKYHGGHISDKQLAELAKETVFFTDISAWLDPDSRAYIRNILAPLLSNYNNKIFIDWSLRVELSTIETNASNKYTQEQSQQAHRALAAMHLLHQLKSVRYNDSDKDEYRTSRDAIIDVVNTMKNKRFTILAYGEETMNSFVDETSKNCLIVTSVGRKAIKVRRGPTMDRAMAFIDPSINEQPLDVSEQEDEIKEDNDNSEPVDENIPKSESNSGFQSSDIRQVPEENYEHIEKKKKHKERISHPFELSSACIKEDGSLLPLSETAGEGSVVYKEDGSSVLIHKKIAEGGEGIIYHTDNSLFVAKIYKREKLTKNRFDKLSLMIKNNPNIEQLCWPADLLFNRKKEFIGYLMPELQPRYKEFGMSVLQLQKDTVRNDDNLGLKDWNRRTLACLCLKLSKTMQKIHAMNIIIGDINPKNFMIDPKHSKQIDFKIVDCDSFQIGPYPCPVGTQAYTSPEIYRRLDTDSPRFGEFLRTINDDEYAFASLLFRIIMLGQSPTASKGETDINRSIRNYHFAYRTDGEGGQDTPDGPYRLMWNNYPKYIQKKFKSVFSGEEMVTDEMWINSFYRFIKDIDNGEYTTDLKPNKYWDTKDRKYTRDFTCEGCGQKTNMPVERYETKIEKDLPLLCNDCQKILDSMRNVPAVVRCSSCGRIIRNPAGRQTKYWETIQADFKRDVLCASCFYKRKG